MAGWTKKGSDTREENELMMLANKKWSKTIQYNLQAGPCSIRSISGELYCCHSEGLTVYDSNFKPMHAILKDDMGAFYSVASTGDGNFMVAAANGLFNVNREGKKLQTIDTDLFFSIQIYEDHVYASHPSTGTIRIYHKSNNWQLKRSFKPTCDKSSGSHWITLFVRDNMIISCCLFENKIRSWSLEGGPYHVYGSKGKGVGEFCSPRLPDVDREHAMLVADNCNHRIQAVSSQGEGCVFELDRGINNPRGAVIFNDNLVVVSYSPNLFTVFSHD